MRPEVVAQDTYDLKPEYKAVADLARRGVPWDPVSVALAIVADMPGSTMQEAATTHSVYVSIMWRGRLHGTVRVSDHQKYGSNQPSHIIPRIKYRIVAQVDRAIRAAIGHAGSYNTVPTWNEIERVSNPWWWWWWHEQV